MSNFFCADNSRKQGEELIGTATNNQTYILIECPQPWMSSAFDSKWVPENLHALVKECKQAKLPIRFLLIANNMSHKVDSTTLLIYDINKESGSGYSKREFKLENIEQAATTIKKWLRGKNSRYEVETDITRDFLVCTHGSHDKCCARYGGKFYFHASNKITEMGLKNLRIWKSSHFGGHRFAPTMIDLPNGRYYGKLDLESFESILTRSGNIEDLIRVYRGWGFLPRPIQVLEKELMLVHGWDWFDYKVKAKILEESFDGSTFQAELTFEKPDEFLYAFKAKLIEDEFKSVTLKAACNASQETTCVKYSVASLALTSSKLLTCVA